MSRLVAVVSRCSTSFKLLCSGCQLAREVCEGLVELGNDADATRCGQLHAKLAKLVEGARGVCAANDRESLATDVASRLEVVGEGVGSGETRKAQAAVPLLVGRPLGQALPENGDGPGGL